MNEDKLKKKEKAEAYFKSKYYRDQTAEDCSDFGAYCVEQWLSGRHPNVLKRSIECLSSI